MQRGRPLTTPTTGRSSSHARWRVFPAGLRAAACRSAVGPSFHRFKAIDARMRGDLWVALAVGRLIARLGSGQEDSVR